MTNLLLWPPVAKPLTQKSEGCRLVAYGDPGGHGPWTIGWGHTAGVHEFQQCSQAQADAWLDQDLLEAADIVERYVAVPLTVNQGAALTDFVYNVGPGVRGQRDGFAFLRSGLSSTLLRLLNAGTLALAAEELLKWKYPLTLPGILIRREAERALFLTP